MRVAIAWSLALSASTAAAVGGQPSGSSTFVAGVADAATGDAVRGAEVILPRLGRIATTGALGEAGLPRVPAGVHRVRVRALGYSPIELDLVFSGDTTGAVFRLTRAAVQLGAVKVEAEWVSPRMRDVEVRRKQGIGRFLDAADLDRVAKQDFGLVAMARFPGLRLVTDEMGHRHLAASRPCAKGGGLAIYLDDVPLNWDSEDLLRTWDLVAVEFYAGTTAPIRYRVKGNECGVLLAWFKPY